MENKRIATGVESKDLLDSKYFFEPARHDGETIEAYYWRRKLSKYLDRMHLKGVLPSDFITETLIPYLEAEEKEKEKQANAFNEIDSMHTVSTDNNDGTM